MNFYKTYLQAAAYVTVGAFLSLQAEISIVAVTIGIIFVIFGFVFLLGSRNTNMSVWLNKIDDFFLPTLYAFSLILVIKDNLGNPVLFWVVIGFLLLLLVMEVIESLDITKFQIAREGRRIAVFNLLRTLSIVFASTGAGSAILQTKVIVEPIVWLALAVICLALAPFSYIVKSRFIPENIRIELNEASLYIACGAHRAAVILAKSILNDIWRDRGVNNLNALLSQQSITQLVIDKSESIRLWQELTKDNFIPEIIGEDARDLVSFMDTITYELYVAPELAERKRNNLLKKAAKKRAKDKLQPKDSGKPTTSTKH